jgi:hypothetical protein
MGVEMTTVRLEAANRWDALEFMDSLLPFHPYLIQKASSWELRATSELEPPTLESELRSRLCSALRRRSLAGTAVAVDDIELVISADG